MKRFLVGLIAGFSFFGSAAAFDLTCPASIRLDHGAVNVLDAAAEPWQRAIREQPQYWLSGLHVFDGRPEGLAELRPAEIGKKTVWDFVAMQSPDGVWVACAYDGTPVRYARRLPDDLKQCTLTRPQSNLYGLSCR